MPCYNLNTPLKIQTLLICKHLGEPFYIFIHAHYYSFHFGPLHKTIIDDMSIQIIVMFRCYDFHYFLLPSTGVDNGKKVKPINQVVLFQGIM